MSHIDDIWASMKEGEDERLGEYKKRAAALKSKANISVVDLIREKEAKTKGKTGTKAAGLSKEKKTPNGENLLGLLGCSVLPKKYAKKDLPPPAPTSVETSEEDGAILVSVQPTITADEMMTKISRDLNSLGSEDVNERRRALTKLHKTLFQDYSMTTAEYGEVFRDCCKPIFKRYADSAEKCRELALLLTESFFEKSSDFVPVLGYFFPVIMQRLPAGIAYDEEMKVFVSDIEAHEAYRRGKAVARQDRVGVLGPATHTVVEVSEEIRHAACRTLGTLVRKVISLGGATILHPYFHEAVMYLQTQLRDPFPDLKQEACEVLELLARTEEFNSGMKFFAVALVRAILPVLRHRHAKVRTAAVSALTACMTVPDRAKLKGSGTEAMPDLVGFREENVLPVASFYTSDVQINHLAELVTDKSVQVKEKVVLMLKEFLTEMGDRYDHQTRLLPYLLDLLTDDAESVSSIALDTLRICGQEYENEHPKDIIEKRQYGVDGDIRINLDKPLPPPFTERPRIGVRLYVRGNTKRFIFGLVNELTNWVSQTRLKSAKLLKVVVVLCEEHLTMESHFLLPAFIKALMFAGEDADKELRAVLLEVYELAGRYMHPEAYLHYILPRLRGDREVLAFGADTATRIAVMELLQALIEGTKPSQLAEFFSDVVTTLTDPFVIDSESPKLQGAALEVLMTLLNSMKGKGKAAVEAHFLATGRLQSLRVVTETLFKFFLTIIVSSSSSSSGGAGGGGGGSAAVAVDITTTAAAVSAALLANGADKPSSEGGGGGGGGGRSVTTRRLPADPLRDRAVAGMRSLVELESDPRDGVGGLFYSHGRSLLQSLLQAENNLAEWEATDLKLLLVLVESPWHIVQSSGDVLDQVLTSLCRALTRVQGPPGGTTTPTITGGESENTLCLYSRLLVSTLLPILYTVYPSTMSQFACYSGGLYDAKTTHLVGGGAAKKSSSISSSTDETSNNINSNYLNVERDVVLSSSDGYLWPGLLLTTTTASGDQHHQPVPQGLLLLNAASVILEKHLNSIIEAYVLDARWSRTPALQCQRVELLSLLSGYSDFTLIGGIGIRSGSNARAVDHKQLLPLVLSSEEEEFTLRFPLLLWSKEGEVAPPSPSSSSRGSSGACTPADGNPPSSGNNSSSSSNTYLMQYFPRILSQILAAAKIPSNPRRFRLAGIRLADHIFQLIVNEQVRIMAAAGTGGSTRTAAAAGKTLKSFIKQQQQCDNNNNNSHSDGRACRSNTVLLLKHCQSHALEHLSSLLVVLDDSCDDVRHAAISCLQTAVPLVSPDDDTTVGAPPAANKKTTTAAVKGSSTADDDDGIADINIAAAVVLSVPAAATFTVIVRRLLRELSSQEAITALKLSYLSTENSQDRSETVVDLIDAALRSLAVLDPDKFTLLVRESVDEAVASGLLASSCGAGGGTPLLSEVLSGLLDHSEMMVEFSKLQISK